MNPEERPTRIVRIENWSVHGAPYAAPETPQARPYLSGEVYGYPGRPDGHKVTTGHIYDAEGRMAYGRRTAYQLGEPSPDYLAWCQKNGIALDPENPIKVRPERES